MEKGADELSGRSEGKVRFNRGTHGALLVGQLEVGFKKKTRRIVSGGWSTGSKARNGK